MTDYSTYTDEELQTALDNINDRIYCHNMGHDSYYLSPTYREEHSILHAIEREIKAREDNRTNSELTSDIMKGYFPNHA